MTEQPARTYLVSVDPDLCAASGVCARMAPDLFRLDDFSDTAEPVRAELGDEDVMERVRDVAGHCPTWAIRWRAADGG